MRGVFGGAAPAPGELLSIGRIGMVRKWGMQCNGDTDERGSVRPGRAESAHGKAR